MLGAARAHTEPRLAWGRTPEALTQEARASLTPGSCGNVLQAKPN
jgi:hypothetical protein